MLIEKCAIRFTTSQVMFIMFTSKEEVQINSVFGGDADVIVLRNIS